ncbi:Multidrug resistance protein MdtC [Candidatus Xiphinematobacter sp. Idaho Grape]|uniref:efflux RND transporter permease subunit n=1 Tax=Candidatus Xiphinematobacter sp. Idaho Grape TaxID=1704307 RepID=UPI0007057704|nr:efflux RND transporter permease subunit [Candidatus Xiphinematobacter sp. Idaho Grape]ALJ56717.1 Multidrug resistance protein MdtC [Candidatus Xiphinematobacter sp. Idaho Grape]
MSIAKFFIEHPRGVSLLVAGMLLWGMSAYLFLPISPLPNVDLPTISISTSLPGASPETVALSLAAPLEKRLGQITGLQRMTSSNTLGSSFITLQFDLNRSIDGAAKDVQAAIQAAKSDLPIGTTPPTYHKINLAGTPIGVLAMTSDALPIAQVYELAEDIVARRLSQIIGIGRVPVYGGARTAIRVQAHPALLANMGMGLNELQDFLSHTNSFTPQGFLATGGQFYGLRTNDQLPNALEYRSLVIDQRNEIPVMLSSVARIIDAEENKQHGGWLNGKRAVILPIFKDPNANAICIIKELHRMLPSLRSWLPSGVHLDVVIDRTQTIHESLHNLQWTLALTVALVLVVIFLFLQRWMPTLIAGVAICLSLAVTFGIMALYGFSLNSISLMALTISVGFLIDDAIILTENIVHHIEEGHAPMEAALRSTRQIGFTVISMALSTVSALIPILFMGGIAGRIFQEFSISLSMIILISSIVSLILIPTFCAQCLYEKTLRLHNTFTVWMESSFSKTVACYQAGLILALQHKKFIHVVLLITLVGSLILYKILPKGFFPQQDIGLMFGVTASSKNLSYLALQSKQQRLAEIILADPAIESVLSIIHRGDGSPGSSYLYVSLKPLSERKVNVEKVIRRLRPKLVALPGMALHLFPAQELRTGGRIGMAQHQYALRSDNFSTLLEWAPRLLKKLREHPKLVDVESNQELDGMQMRVRIDHSLAGQLGIQSEQISAALRCAFGQQQVSTVYSSINQSNVILEAGPEFSSNPNSLNKIHIKSSSGNLVPLGTIASFEKEKSLLSVNHEDQSAAVILSFNLKEGVALGKAIAIVEKACSELHIPASIRGEFVGNAKLLKKTSLSQPLLVLAAIAAVYIVLGVLYESLLHPLTILSTLPIASIGALLALLLTGIELSIMAMIGIILLVGIMKRNAIIMVDFAIESQRRRGLSAHDAIYQAAIVRFRPILMTNITALLGALPLAIGRGNGAELRQPLGVTIIGGVLASQVLTLFTTPVIYLTLEHLKGTVTRAQCSFLQWQRGPLSTKIAHLAGFPKGREKQL